MRIPECLKRLAVMIALCCSAPPALAEARPSNIVLIIADDLGVGDVRYLRSGPFATPNLDRLSRESTLFTNAYVTAAVCSPSRAGLHTGRYQARFGHDFNPGSASDQAEMSLPPGVPTIAGRLQRAGYFTGLVGKWHLEGRRAGASPLERGFEHYFGFASGGSYILNPREGDLLLRTEGEPNERTRSQGFSRMGAPVEIDDYKTDVLTREALEFLARADTEDRPFFLVLAHHAPHVPLEATKAYVDRVAHITDPRLRAYAAMVTALDDSVGAVLEDLSRRGLREETLIIFLSDNGCPPYISQVCSNAPYSGHKRDLGEGGLRSPFLIRWPKGTDGPKVYSKPVISLDLAGTILGAAGLQDQIRDIDGVDLSIHVKASGMTPHEALYWRAGTDLAIRKGGWKLIQVDLPQGGRQSFLFDLQRDPGETRNLAPVHSEKVRELEATWRRWNEGNTPSRMQGRVTTTRIAGVEVLARY
ncbi:MAG: sulfatase-like hydrolase/transferase [Brevundimonas sp.]|nr:sulfatase-like hydrolase/transferase [Brevundimonas sp.]